MSPAELLVKVVQRGLDQRFRCRKATLRGGLAAGGPRRLWYWSVKYVPWAPNPVTWKSNVSSSRAENTAEHDPCTETDVLLLLLVLSSSGGLQKVHTLRCVALQERPTLKERSKQMDLHEIVVTLVLPSIVVVAAARWGYQQPTGSGRRRRQRHGRLEQVPRHIAIVKERLH
jgi:hypothetical protein